MRVVKFLRGRVRGGTVVVFRCGGEVVERVGRVIGSAGGGFRGFGGRVRLEVGWIFLVFLFCVCFFFFGLVFDFYFGVFFSCELDDFI